jgi:amino acid adenylation domain-containing protein/FkbH-like protein
MQKATFPMHPAQQDIYVDQLINKNSPHYNLGGYIKLKGILDKKKFKMAVDSAPEVFDVFKMRFDEDSEYAEYTLSDSLSNPSISEIDFSGKSDSETEAKTWMQDRFNSNFELKTENPLYEHALLKISDEEHWFFGRYHHLNMDGFGFIVFIQYVARKYKFLTEGGEEEFNYPSYQDETVKANDYLNSKSFSDDLNYWIEKVNFRPEPLLQRSYHVTGDSENKSGKLILDISDEQRKEFFEIEKTTDSGIQQLILAALIIYFGKTTNTKKTVFGVPVHKRNSKVLRNITGMFSGVLPFVSVYEEGQTVKELLAEIRKTQRSDYRHQNVPISAINRKISVNSGGENLQDNLFDISINYEPLNFSPDFGREVKAEVNRLESDFDLNTLQLFWRDYGVESPIQFIAKYSKEYFNEIEIELFAKRLLFITKQLPGSLDSEVKSVRILPDEEAEMVRGFGETMPAGKTEFNSVFLTGLMQDQVNVSPEKTALIYNNESLSYKDLHERSNKLANYLITKGVTKESLVPICIERSMEMIIGILGILKAGGAYVPIDPEYPKDRISFILEDTAASIIISSKESSLKLPVDEKTERVLLDDPDVLESIGKHSKDNPVTNLNSYNAAYVIYTSGSTGKPKGVIIEHTTVVNLIKTQSEYFKINSDDRILQFSNYSFDASVEQIFLALCNGAALVLFSEGLQLSQDRFTDYLIEKKITHLHATPAFLESIIPLSKENKFLKRVIAGGDVCKKELSEYWKNKVSFYNEYGPTETTVTAIEYNVKENTDNSKNITLPIGKPLKGVKVYVINRYDEICPVGVSGEICISGNCLARGYLNQPELTKEKFVENPFSNHDGKLIYRTGDLGRWLTDGNIEYLGRLDDQVKIRGYRIELGEIESILLESDMVKNSVVLSKPDNNGNPGLVAYIISDEKFDRNNIKNHLRKKLPEYMIPSFWIVMDSFPLTSNGKIDRKAFPDPEVTELIKTEYIAAESETEIKLTGLWKEILNIEKIGVNDNFFELGGHSLIAIRLSAKINKLFNVNTDIGTIFSNPTIRKLSKVIEQDEKKQFKNIVKIPEKEHYELSHSQKRFWILSKFKDGSEAYNISNIFEIEGKLNPAAFKRAFKEVMERHEILRTVFVEIDGEPYQKILTFEQTGFEIIEKDLNDNSELETELKKYQEEDIKKSFDLENGPLIRVSLFKVTEEKHYVLFNIHHIISDGWSKGILIKEFLHLYNAYCNSGENDLSPLTVQYKDYAEWHRSTFEQQGQYWKEVYMDGIPVMNFPADNERPKVLSYSGDKISISLSEELTDSLQKLAVSKNLSLNNLLFILYGLAVAQKSLQEDVVIGSVCSGRSHSDLEELVGVFINFLPIRLHPERNLRLNEYIKKSSDQILKAFRNQDYPFDLMVEDNIKKRDISRNPFFDTMMNFQINDISLEDISIPDDNENKDNSIKLKQFGSGNDDLFQSVLDFKLDAVPEGLKIILHLSYNTKLYSQKRMKEFLNDYTGLLEIAVNEPEKFISEFSEDKSGNVNMQLDNNTESENKKIEKSGSPIVSAMPVNICSSFVIEPVLEYMEYWSNEIDINIKINFAPYNQVFQQLINPGSLLYSDKGINFIFISTEDWIRDKKDLSSEDQIKFLNKTYSEFKEALKNAVEKTFIPFLVMPVKVNVITENNFSEETIRHLNKLNNDLETFLKDIPSVQLIETDTIKELYNVEEVFDPKSDELGHMPFTPEFYAALGTYMTRKVSAYMNPSYKVIALDCDNTLWKGICGETGALNVEIDQNFTDLQEFFIEKYKEGFLLVLSSKNNEDDVWEVFDKHPGMKLKREHIAAYRINWDPKPQNLLSIANELNLGINSFVFLDDNEFETDQMSQSCPDVLSLTLPDEDESFSEFLNHIWAFDYFRITDEDRKRNEMYRVEKQRKNEEGNFETLKDYLKSLEIKVDIKTPEAKDLDRAVQLTLRTNQFNLNGIRKTPEEVTGFMKNQDSICRIIDVKDRFGEYGIVGLVLAKINGNALDVETFLLSCRVLGRNVEGTILAELENYCIEKNLEKLNLHFQQTQKNKPFQEFLESTEWIKDSNTNVHSKNIKITEETSV